jgi:hypothetical protein
MAGTHNSLNNIEIDKAAYTAKGDLLAGSGTGTEVTVPISTDGKLLKADSGAAGGVSWTDAVGDTDEKAKCSSNDSAAGYLEDKLLAGTGLSVGAGIGTPEQITISVIGGGLAWPAAIVGATAADGNKGYICNHAATRVELTLPSTAVVGTIIRVTGIGVAGWMLKQNASQVVHFGNVDTTTGTGGSLSSTHDRDSIELVCVVANTDWNILSAVGNISYV